MACGRTWSLYYTAGCGILCDMGKEPDKAAYLTVRVLPEQRRALERAAKREDRSISSVVRALIEDWRAKQQNTQRST